MDDYSALAQRISVGVPGVSGSLVLSRDGLVLGAHPDEVEGAAKLAWLRFTSLGEPDKSFVEFPDQVWAYVKRGAYAAFAVADALITTLARERPDAVEALKGLSESLLWTFHY